MKGKKNRKPKRSNNGNKAREFNKEERYYEGKSSDVKSQREDRDYMNSKANDPAWYSRSPELMRAYASFPFGVAIGNELQTGISTVDSGAIPGLMTFEFVPTIGVSTQANDPINVAMRNIYSWVRHANSGHANYDAPDLMMYIVAMDSVLMYHSFIRRLLGVIQAFTPTNRYYPRALIDAMYVDYDDITKHIPDLRGFVNMYSAKMGSLCIPNSMSYMARHQWMCEGLYVDSVSDKAQTYMYMPVGYYQLAYTSGDAPVFKLAYHMWAYNGNTKRYTFDDIVAFGNSLLNPLLSNEDINIMSGDILKAFGQDGVIKYVTVPDEYIVLPMYQQEVMSQFENMTILPGMITLADVTQDTTIGGGFLKCQPVSTEVVQFTSAPPTPTADIVKTLNAWYESNKYINFHHDGVTPEEIMVATRLCPTFNTAGQWSVSGTNWTKARQLDSCGSEVVTSARIYSYLTESSGRNIVSIPMHYVNYATSSGSVDIAYLSSLLKLNVMASAFDWCPQHAELVALQVSGSTARVSNPQGLILDFDYSTVLSPDNLKNLHTAALLSEFSVPQAGLMA